MEVTTKFTLVVGCPSSLRQLPSGRCLVIDAESVDKDKWLLQEACITHPWPLDFKQSVITKTDNEIIKWHIFSDERFNGPWPLTSYINQYPNLRSIGFRELKGESLASILSNQDSLAHSSSTFQLILRQGDPFDALTSAGAWLPRCSCIIFRCKNCSEASLLKCEQLLESLGFHQSCDDSSFWSPQLDPLQSLLLNPPSERDISPSDKSLLEFLFYLFPFEYYMNIRPDLAGKSKEDLLIHFWVSGITEGVDLSESCIHDRLVSDVKSSTNAQINALTGRIHELEKLLSSTRLQMNELHLLINRLRKSGRADD